MVLGLFGTTYGYASPIAALTKFGITFSVPASLYIKTSKAVNQESLNENTQCLQLFFKSTNKFAGEFCASINPDFLNDKGVASYDSIPSYARTVERPESGLIVLSPLSQYPLEPFVDKTFKSYAATVDCDEVNGPIYRATSSCHIAVSAKNKKILYSNFIIKSHINRSTVVSIDDRKKLWTSLNGM